MKAEQLAELFKSTREYEKSHMGLKYGPDFPEVARLLQSLKEEWSHQLMMLMVMVSLQPKPDIPAAASSVESFRDYFLSSPAAEPAAFLFYVGFLTGKREAEIQRLEGMAEEKHA